jgi:predicted DNA-binding WGR domain protein
MAEIYLCQEDQHNKFWQYEINGFTVNMQWGRVGEKIRTLTKTFNNHQDMWKFLNAKIREKERKHYKKTSSDNLQNEVKTAAQLGSRYKISKLKFVDHRGGKLHTISNYDPKRFVYVEVLNSWSKEITRLMLSKEESHMITGGVTESSGVIAYGNRRAVFRYHKENDFVNAVKDILNRISAEVVEAVKTVNFAAVGCRNLFGDESESGANDELSAALASIDTSSVSSGVISQFASLGARSLEL